MTRPSLLRAVLWMGGSLVAFSLTAMSVRNLATTLGVFEILAIRSVFGVVILGSAFALPALRPRLALRRPLLHLARNVPHTAGQAAWAYGVTVLPLATAFALEFTAPIWVTVLAVLLLGERLTVPRMGAVVLGLAGVLVILRPGAGAPDTASLLVLAAAFAFALTGVVTRALTRTEGTLAILFWMNLIQLPLNLLGSQPDFPARIQAGQWAGILGVGLCGIASHLSLTQAYRHAEATVVIPLDFLRIPLIAAVGALLYGERLDGWVFAGALLIVVGIGWSLAAEARRPADASRPPAARAPATAPSEGRDRGATSSRRPGSGPGSG